MMKISTELLKEFQKRLKIGNRRGVHLNAVPGKSNYKLDLATIEIKDKNLPKIFIEKLLTEDEFIFKIDIGAPNLASNTNQQNILSHGKISKVLLNLFIQNQTVKSEKGINTFGFGYPIVCLRSIKDSKIIVAPILIWELSLSPGKNANSYEIGKFNDSRVLLNEVLINFIGNDFGRTIKIPADDFNEDDKISKESILRICKQILYNFSSNTNNEIQQDIDLIFHELQKIPEKENLEKIVKEPGAILFINSGLFSLFETQKQIIIDEYDKLIVENKEFDFNQVIENRDFQPLSAIETDPSQQQILANLNLRKYLLLQGPPGTGKSQTLTSILINALENNKKVLVVCEKNTALEVLINSLKKLKLDEYCILLRDLTKDRKIVVERVRHLAKQHPTHTFSGGVTKNLHKNNLLNLELAINNANEKLNELNKAYIDDQAWKYCVGKYLKCNRELKDLKDIPDLSKVIDLSKKNYQKSADELKQGEKLYRKNKYRKSLKILDARTALKSDIVKYEVLVSQKLHQYEILIANIDDSLSQIIDEYIEKKQKEARLLFRDLFQLIDLSKNILNEYKNNANFLSRNYTTLGRKLLNFFSNESRESSSSYFTLKAKIELIQNKIEWSVFTTNLVTYGIRDVTYEKLEDLRIALKKCHENLPSVLANLKSNFDIYTAHTSGYTSSKIKETIFLITNLVSHVTDDKIIDPSKVFKSKKQSSVELNVDKQTYEELRTEIWKLSRLIKSDPKILEYWYNWMNFYHKQDRYHQFIIKRIFSFRKWSTIFLYNYFKEYILNNFSARLPLTDDDFLKLRVQLNNFKDSQIDFVRQISAIQCQTAIDDFRKSHPDTTIEAMYNLKVGIKNRTKLSLRNLVRYDIDFFTKVFPIILTTPEVSATIFPKEGYFDIVLFDEASQLKVEDTFPSLLKGKQIVVSGDEHQMPPSSYFTQIFDGILNDDEEIDSEKINTTYIDSILESESLLEFASYLKFYEVFLEFHYRSRHPLLIDFSNHAFYGRRLKPLPPLFNYTPINYINVGGLFINHENQKEAEKVLSIIDLEINPINGEYPSLGVATFNLSQRNLILRKIIERKSDARYAKFNNKIDKLEAKGFFVKNLENIQGDERDIIILSTTFGPNTDNKFYHHFGPLNFAKGYRLLNVIITRAKYKIFVITSFPEPTFLSYKTYLEHIGSNNRRSVLFAYLAYAKAVSEGNIGMIDEIFKSLDDFSPPLNPNHQPDGLLESPFEEEVYYSLCDKIPKDRIIIQYEQSGFRIDLVYLPKNKWARKIAIECDGETYHNNSLAYLNDLSRQKILESNGFVFYRIWSTNWWRHPELELKQLLKFINMVENENHQVASDELLTFYQKKNTTEISHSISPNEPVQQTEESAMFQSNNVTNIYVQSKNNTEKNSIIKVKDSTDQNTFLRITQDSLVTLQNLKDSRLFKCFITKRVELNNKFNDEYRAINEKSPLGRELINRIEGDEITVPTTGTKFKIVKVLKSNNN